METIGVLRSNPILTVADVPYDPALVFDVGVAKFQGQYVMAFRGDYAVNDSRAARSQAGC